MPLRVATKFNRPSAQAFLIHLSNHYFVSNSMCVASFNMDFLDKVLADFQMLSSITEILQTINLSLRTHSILQLTPSLLYLIFDIVLSI